MSAADGGIIPADPNRHIIWTEPAPHGCELLIPLDPERTARNIEILANARRKLTLDNFNTTPAIQPPALTED